MYHFWSTKILKKTLNVQDRIEVQGGKLSGKSINVQGEKFLEIESNSK